jgi:hypothetical protein
MTFFGGIVMKKLVVLVLVLAISCVANAGLSIRIDGGPPSPCVFGPGDVLTLSIVADASQLANCGVILAIDGAAAVDFSTATNTVNYGAFYDFTGAGFDGQFVVLADLAIPGSQYPLMGAGIKVDGIKITIGNWGSTIFIRSTDPAATPDAGLYDPIVMAVIPEPMTLGLLSLGGLFLRRRSAKSH